MKLHTYFIIVLSVFCTYARAQTDVLVDSRDGKNYKTIQIGSKIWMAENLDFRPYLMLLSNWADTSKPTDIFCYNDDTSNCKKYGALYRHNALKNACPVGWHLPTEEDFKMLLNTYSDDKKKAYLSLISGGSSGFNLPLNGWYTHRGYYIGINKAGGLWSSTEKGKYYIKVFVVNKYSSKAFITSNIHDDAISVRCVKD